MITTETRKYLKNATPTDLMKLTNGVPWEICAWIKLTKSQPNRRVSLPEVIKEQSDWIAAGAVRDKIAATSWIIARLHDCAECGFPKPHDRNAPGRRATFSKEHGFGLHHLCSVCLDDFDNHPQRWQGRCLAKRQAVTK